MDSYYLQNDNHSTFALWKECDNVKIKLQDYNDTLEKLTTKVLKLDVFKPRKKYPKKNSNSKNHKQKNVHKNSYKNHQDEFFVIKKLLVINLKSFKVLQKLFQENSDLQKSLDKTYQPAYEEKIKQENDYLKTAANFFETGLSLFFGRYDKVADRMIIKTSLRSGVLQNRLIANGHCESILQQTCKSYEYSTANTNITANPIRKSNYTNDVQKLIICCKKSSHGFNLQFASKLAVLYEIPIQLSYIFYLDIDCGINQLHFERICSTKPSIQHEIHHSQQPFLKQELIDSSPLQVENVRTLKDNNDLIVFEDTRSLLLLKDFYFLSRNILELSKITNSFFICENLKNNSELYRFINENDVKKIKIPLDLTFKKTNQSIVFDKNINSIGVGNDSILFCDQQSQVEETLFTKIALADKKRDGLKNVAQITFEHKIGEGTTFKTIKSSLEAVKNASDGTDSRHDFKRSLQALREVMEICKTASRQCPTAKKSYKTEIGENKRYLMVKPLNEEVQNNKIKPGKEVFRNSKKEYKKIPDMDKSYQIVLQNNIPHGTNLKFMKLNNSNAQLNISNTYSSHF